MRMQPSTATAAVRARARIPAADDLDVWLLVAAPGRPRSTPRLIAELAGPEYRLASGVESARLEDRSERYRAHWRCRFEANGDGDEFSALRLLKRLTGAGFRVLRFDAVAADLPGLN